MIPLHKRTYKRTAEALDRIQHGKRFAVNGRKWLDPITLTRGGFLKVDGATTTLKCCDALEHRVHQWTANDAELLIAVLRDERSPHRLWVCLWEDNRSRFVVEPIGTDVKEADKTLAQRFPHA